MRSGSDLLDIPACDIIPGKRMANDVQFIQSVGVVSVIFNPGHRKHERIWLTLLVQ